VLFYNTVSTEEKHFWEFEEFKTKRNGFNRNRKKPKHKLYRLKLFNSWPTQFVRGRVLNCSEIRSYKYRHIESVTEWYIIVSTVTSRLELGLVSVITWFSLMLECWLSLSEVLESDRWGNPTQINFMLFRTNLWKSVCLSCNRVYRKNIISLKLYVIYMKMCIVYSKS